jgi:hypothetical protein
MLGHSSITITSDTYTSLLPEADLAIAEAAARLVPRARATFEDTGPEADLQSGEAEDAVPRSASRRAVDRRGAGRAVLKRPARRRRRRRPA